MRSNTFIQLFVFTFLIFFVHTADAAFDSADFNQQKDLRITRMTPAGSNVPATKQIVFQFSRPVVPIGRMERDATEVPITITPKIKCQWRWINTSSLACQLDKDNGLTLSTKYSVVVEPTITAEDGGALKAQYKNDFTTQVPRVSYHNFSNWQSPGTPVIRMTFNQSVSKSSLEKHLYLSYHKAGSDKAYKTRDLKVEKDPQDKENPRFIMAPGESYVLDFGKSETIKSDDDLKEVDGEEARRIWLISPNKELPLDVTVDLKIEPGLVSAFGPEKGTENRTVVNFNTFPEFKFIGISCSENTGKTLKITKENVAVASKCSPMRSTSLLFSSPVLNSQVKENIVFQPDLAGGRKDYDPWANRGSYSKLKNPHRKGREYRVWLPEFLKAEETYSFKNKKAVLKGFDKIKAMVSVVRASDLEDEFGRTLKEPIDFTFYTDNRPPNFKITHSTAVLEQGIDSEAPLYVTNLKTATFDYRKLTTEGQKTGQKHVMKDLDVAKDIQYAVPIELRKMLDGNDGAVYATLSSDPSVPKYNQETRFLGIVTPYQLHVKMGHHNSVVWVVDLKTGKPVKDASVTIYKDIVRDLSADVEILDQAETGDTGLASLKGIKELDPSVSTLRSWCREGGDGCERFFVRVQKGDNMAVMPLDRRFESNAYRVSNYSVMESLKKEYGHIHTWGTTAQGVYSAGDKMQFKFYVRDQGNEQYIPAPKGKYTLEIVDPKGKTVHEVKEFELSEFGSYSDSYQIPKTASVGWYQFKLKSDFTNYNWTPMRVLISDFTPASFKVSNGLNGDMFRAEDTVEVQSFAKLHSGGPYTDASARVTAILKGKYFSSKHPVATGFRFDSYRRNNFSKKLFQKNGMLGDKGEMIHSFALPKEDIFYGRLTVETAVRDDRGKYIASSSTADYLGVDRFVGLKNTSWLYKEGEQAEIKYIVVDPKGAPIDGTNVDIKIERLHTKSSKVKGAGNAYLTHFIDEWLPAGDCKGASVNESLSCRFTPEKPGNYKITAQIQDTKGRVHSTEIRAWVAGKGRVVWRSPNSNALPIVPEKAEYNIGDKARYLIKNPYPGAQALVSIERYGILKSWVQTLKGSTPTIEFEIEKDFMPGFYLSVTIVSPRIEAPPPKTGQIDLGKPGFKMGYVKVPVKDPYKQIDVTIKTDAEVYKPKDTVTATIQVEPKHKDTNDKIEIAVTVLDESVLDLVQGGAKVFDPYEGFYKLDALDLKNYSLISRLIGRQKFEKKGANPGGDGGVSIEMRSLFKYVSYWNPSIKPDKDGNAKITFEVPDNLTGWRVLAFAVTPNDRMGLGHTNFKVNRPTEVRPVMPNQVTEGDTFKAGFSVMNRTDKPRDIDVVIKVAGNVDKDIKPLTKTVHLKPYKRETVYMPIKTTRVEADRNIKEGEVAFTVTASDKIDGDGVMHYLPVYKRRSLDVAASYGTTIKDTVTENLLFPKNIHTDVGNVSVVLSPSVIGNVDGAFRYMRDYPYGCWEQRLSKGLMASHYKNLKDYLPDALTWKKSATLTEDTLKQAANYQAPNGGMVYFVAQNRYVSPYLSAYTALAFNWLRDSGYEVPQTVEANLHGYLKTLLKQETVPSFYSRGMSSTVRAVALAALAPHGDIDLNDLERYRPQLKYMSLFGQSNFLQAAMALKAPEDLIKETSDLILSTSIQSGGKFSFNEELDDSYRRILSTPLKANCSILSSLTKLGETKFGASAVGDIPFKLVRTITQTRGNRDHWENTQENIFCLNSLVDYSRIYESTRPNMNVSVKMDDRKFGKTSFRDLKDDAVTLAQPITKTDPGKKRRVKVSRKGDGRLYYATRISYAPLDDHEERQNAGIDIRKEYSVERDDEWVLLSNPSAIKRGDLVRVDIYVSAPTARNFVVVDDPVPGGLEPVNHDLATTSIVDADKGKFKAAGGAWWFQFDDWRSFNVSRWSFYHQEINHDAVRFYSDYLPAGNYHLSYTAQAISEGNFTNMPVHAEEMYDPDIFGKGLSGTLKVAE